MKKAKKISFGDVKSFTINRKYWARGNGTDVSNHLLNRNGTRCCLGFYAQACGIPDKELRGVGLVSDVVRSSTVEWNTRLADDSKLLAFAQDKPTTQALVDTNDSYIGEYRSSPASEEEREKKIANLFKRFGITVKFVG